MSGRYGGGGGGGGGGPPPHAPSRYANPPPGSGDYHHGPLPPPRHPYPPSPLPAPPRGGGGGGGGRYDENPPNRGGGGGPPPRRGGGGGPRHHRMNRNNQNPNVLTFPSYEHELEFVQERRRKRLARASKFDVLPDPAAAGAAVPTPPAGGGTIVLGGGGILPGSGGGDGTAVLQNQQSQQQTRHARRLYVGNLPLGITEEQIHHAFRTAIATCLVHDDEEEEGRNHPIVIETEDPILSVYIHQERRFCFVEFNSVDLCTACMDLDGLVVVPRQPPVKVKRPNDYISSAIMPQKAKKPIRLDVSKMGIISSNVVDGPNKIFIGGLHYHLQEPQVLELLGAFGKVKAFHLVKNDDHSMGGGGCLPSTSKGYCFVEYADPNVTPIAVQGLNGMDIGGGKSLTARLAGERHGSGLVSAAAIVVPPSATTVLHGNKDEANSDPNATSNHTIVAGFDVEAMVDAALGKGAMPSAPTHFDSLGQPLTRIVVPLPLPLLTKTPTDTESRILVLRNVVTDDDLATSDDQQTLEDEIRDECRKFGNLRSIRIEKRNKKVYLEYQTAAEAQRAQHELEGRQFGNAIVQTDYHDELDFAAGRFL